VNGERKSESSRRKNMPMVMAVIVIIILALVLVALNQIDSTDGRCEGLARCFTGTVTEIIDGDTIEIKGGDRVRYLGIDAPEIVHPSEPVEYFGKEATEKNRELVEGKRVTLERDVEDRDEYGRLLRYVWRDDIMVNAELVRLGYAYAYSLPPNVKYQELFLQLEKEAREQRLGLWAE